MSEGPTVQTTVRVPEALHRQAKLFATGRGMSFQDLIEASLKKALEGGLDTPPAEPRRRKSVAVPAGLEQTVAAFARFWEKPKDETALQLRDFLEGFLERYK